MESNLKFEPFSLSALKRMLPYIRQNPSYCSDLSSGYLYMWREGVDMEFCVFRQTFCVRQIVGGQPAFSWPFGADPGGMVDELIRYTSGRKMPLRFFAVDEKTLPLILADRRLPDPMYAFDRNWSDYLYSFEEAMTFPGKKYSGQRNHIHKFERLYGKPQIRPLTPADRPAVIELLDAFAQEHPDAGALEQLERVETEALFDACEELGLYAAGLFVDDRLAALSIGEVIRDTLFIHVEKALTVYEGIYPTLYSSFVRLTAQLHGSVLTYVNREDDSGDIGLRTSKMQYHPVFMADKYLVHVDSPGARIQGPVCIPGRDVVLTEIRESDKAAYLSLNTDVENNRYWGYDYRNDLSLPQKITEQTFYDSVKYDMQAGDSVNFAIRLSEDGPMIGEAILWNFSSDGSAELGCRILRPYQGHGYGKDAFGTAARYGADELGLSVYARCHRDNLPSRRMIEASGFSPLCRNEAYLYFRYQTTPESKDTPCGAIRCKANS